MLPILVDFAIVIPKYRRPRDFALNNGCCELCQYGPRVVACLLPVELISREYLCELYRLYDSLPGLVSLRPERLIAIEQSLRRRRSRP